MAETTNKNQNTLYRFVSLRNPEKSPLKNNSHRFVYYFEGKNDKENEIKNLGVFYKAVVNKTLSDTKWNTLTNLSFTPFQDVVEIEALFTDYYVISDWISRNRKAATAAEIYAKVTTLAPLDLKKEELILWDNLFYTVIKNQNSYIKEVLVQLLVLQNLVKHLKILSSEEAILVNIINLANATVVLPLEVFEENTSKTSTNSAKRKSNDLNIFSTDLMNAQDIASAKTQIDSLESAKNELYKIESKQKIESKKNYTIALEEYELKNKPVLDKYNQEYLDAKFKLEVAAQTNKDLNTNLIDVKFPKIDPFKFSEPIEIESERIQSKLTEQSIEIINKTIDWKDIETFNDIYKNIDNAIATENKKIINNTVFSEQYVSFGDTFFPVSKPTNKVVIICCEFLFGNNYNIVLSFNNTIPVQGIEYKLKLQDGTYSQSNNISAPIAYNNGITTIGGLYGVNGFFQNINNKVVDIEVTLKIDNIYYTITAVSGILLLIERNCVKGSINQTTQTSNPDDYTPKGFGFRQLGIADYKKVVTEICTYRAGEVAHIENIMAGETREKVTTKTHKSEITQTDSQEQESEKISDTISTERFEMQSEIAKMQQEQKSLDAYANVQAGGAGWSLDAGASYATNTSKEESNRQAVIQAKEQTERAMERIVNRVKTEKTVKITNEFIEANKHRFENLSNPNNVSGVFRFINAVYKNEIQNYGKRLMYEFMIPQPSKLHRLGLESVKENVLEIKKPIDPRSIIDFDNFEKLNATNYQKLVSDYNAQNVKIYPAEFKTIGKTFSGAKASDNEVFEQNYELPIPDGYKTITLDASIYGTTDRDGSQLHSFAWVVGNRKDADDGLPLNKDRVYTTTTLAEFTDKISISLHSLNYVGINFSFTIKCQITAQAISNWRKDTYEAIINGYEEQLRIFNEKQAIKKSEGIKILDSNPLFYRQTEQLILRKNCISYLIDNTNQNTARRFGLKTYNTAMNDSDITFFNHQVDVSQKMDDYSSFAKFMEQAFEWNLMSYNFYPFYWGNNQEWDKLYQFETNDPTYRAFMQSGMARVVVTVKPGFENAIMHFMAFGQIWNGGQLPVLGNPLYISIVDELKEQEYTIEDVWETVVPTNLVALQESGVAISGGGLPTLASCVDHQDRAILLNDVTLGNLEKSKK